MSYACLLIFDLPMLFFPKFIASKATLASTVRDLTEGANHKKSAVVLSAVLSPSMRQSQKSLVFIAEHNGRTGTDF